jgi:hypothetical protein
MTDFFDDSDGLFDEDDWQAHEIRLTEDRDGRVNDGFIVFDLDEDDDDWDADEDED